MFKNRKEAGGRLAKILEPLKGTNCLVLALPHGGIPVAAEISAALNAPMDIIFSRRLRSPLLPKMTLGAICESDEPLWHEIVLRRSGFSPDDLGPKVTFERLKILREINVFRSKRPLVNLNGRTVILVDDGIDTGATALAAIKFLKRLEPSKIIVAVPLAFGAGLKRVLKSNVEVQYLFGTDDAISLGQLFEDFDPLSDKEALQILQGKKVSSSSFSNHARITEHKHKGGYLCPATL